MPTGLSRCSVFATFDMVNITIWKGTTMEKTNRR